MTTRATPTTRTPLRLPLHPLAPLGEPLNAAQKDRYARHLNLPGVGEDGQRRLSAARVLVIGAGGLGSPVLLYLAAAGVGTIGIVDDDVVDSSNLQRQVIHSTAAVGKRKVDTAAERMQGINPDLIVKKFPLRLHPADIDTYRTQFGSQWDLIVDATDNFASRYLVNDLATALGIPEVMGSVSTGKAKSPASGHNVQTRNAPSPYGTSTLKNPPRRLPPVNQAPALWVHSAAQSAV